MMNRSTVLRLAIVADIVCWLALAGSIAGMLYFGYLSGRLP